MEQHKKPLIIITGPTAVGKTALSIELAKEIGGEIISADSMQIYKYMNIGTAKVMPSEMDGVKHYLIDELEPFESFDVTSFQKKAKAAMNEIYAKGKIPIIAGGTGFYIQSVLYDIDFAENDADTTYRRELMELSKLRGNAYLHEMLAAVDEKAAQQIHANNIKRVIRALEFYHQTGMRISEHNEEQHEKESPYDYMYFVLTDDRTLLYDRIEKRIDLMLENGLVDEVKSLIDRGCRRDMVSMQAIGYKEFFDYFDEKISLDEAVARLRLDTRHFAKRQLTWFRRERDVIWMDYQNYNHDRTQLFFAMLKKIGEHYGNQ
jgi:tRNA dimethylallyltransferase